MGASLSCSRSGRRPDSDEVAVVLSLGLECGLGRRGLLASNDQAGIQRCQPLDADFGHPLSRPATTLRS